LKGRTAGIVVLPEGVTHQDKVRDAYTQCEPSHELTVFVGQQGDDEGSNEWKQDNRGQPRKSIGYHNSEQKYLPVNKPILLLH
jgi:hypothetical protein